MIRLLAIVLSLASLSLSAAPAVPKWTRFERSFQSATTYANPVQDVDFRVEFRSPSGVQHTVYGFWDGGRTWRVRLTPDEVGRWTYRSLSSDQTNAGLHSVSGTFECSTPRKNGSRFDLHGPIVISKNGMHLEHADGTPFFWLADTAWNGPLAATPADWDLYIKRRMEQGFTAVQWVATQWRGAPNGDSRERLAFLGREKIAIDLDFFRQLEVKHDALIRAGLVSAPVMLWAINRGPEDEVNPGVSLPDRQAILLARYMAARWNADPVVWLLNGDGDYRREKAERWRTVGRGVFQEVWHAPVSLHPGGLMWVMDGFGDESWLSIAGYQSAHGDSEHNSRWITTGEPATYWKSDRARALLSLEGPFESPARPAQTLKPDYVTRRNHYWSILNAPIAGITYGASGIWSWSDGASPVPGHGSAVPLSWKAVLDLPAAAQMTHLIGFFRSLEYWRLQPAPGVLARQPGGEAVDRYISAAQTPEQDLTVFYTPADLTIVVVPSALPAGATAEWFNPRTGERSVANSRATSAIVEFSAPAAGDWLLVVKGTK